MQISAFNLEPNMGHFTVGLNGTHKLPLGCFVPGTFEPAEQKQQPKSFLVVTHVDN